MQKIIINALFLCIMDGSGTRALIKIPEGFCECSCAVSGAQAGDTAYPETAPHDKPARAAVSPRKIHKKNAAARAGTVTRFS